MSPVEHEMQMLNKRLRRLEDRDSDRAEQTGPECEPSSGRVMESMCSRQNARSMVEMTIKRLHGDADSLQALLDTLPAKISPEADVALWGLVQRFRGSLS